MSYLLDFSYIRKDAVISVGDWVLKVLSDVRLCPNKSLSVVDVKISNPQKTEKLTLELIQVDSLVNMMQHGGSW